MSLMSELRIRARHVLLPAFGVAAVFYFAYHGVNGDRGLLAWRAMQQQVADARADLDRRAQRARDPGAPGQAALSARASIPTCSTSPPAGC